MPVTILSSDIAYATVADGRLALHYTGESIPPGYFLILRDVDGTERSRSGPYESEDLAIEAARSQYDDPPWRDL